MRLFVFSDKLKKDRIQENMNKKINLFAIILKLLLIVVLTGCNSGNVINETTNNNNGTTVDTSTDYNTASCEHTGSGSDYPVGPGQTYETIGDVPWNDLGPGDTVRIYWKSTSYNEKILIRGQGTVDEPIRVCGVPNDGGERPLLSGENATSRTDLDFGSYLPMQDLGLITIYHRDYYTKSANIIIEGLHLERAHPDYQYTNTLGELRSYENGAACIRVQAADNVIIRNNEINDCGNGLFAMSQDYTEFHITRNILIEGNYLHDNGVSGEYRQHNLYIQSIGATYQYNRFGRNRDGVLGGNLKDRSVGTIIRYNWFDGSQRIIDLVEVEDYRTYIIEDAYIDSLGGDPADPDMLAEVRANEVIYRKAYVYGNLIRSVGSTDGSLLIHYGFDNVEADTRKGTLYFYNNTVVMLADQSDAWRTRVFDLSTADETAEVFNNIIYMESETGATPTELNLTRDSGVVNLGINWISDGWIDGSGTVNGASNLIDTTMAATPINTTTLAPLNEATIIGQGQSFPTEVATNYPLSYQYQPHQSGDNRTSDDDLGAYEYGP